jgi:hypothetical protein
MIDLGEIKDEHDLCDESEWNFMLMDWVVWSPDREISRTFTALK